MTDEIELYTNLNVNQKLTQNNFDNLNVRFQVEHHILNRK